MCVCESVCVCVSVKLGTSCHSDGEMRLSLGSSGEGKCTDLRGARTSSLISPFLFCLFFLYFWEIEFIKKRKKSHTHTHTHTHSATFCTMLIVDFGRLYGISGAIKALTF